MSFVERYSLLLLRSNYQDGVDPLVVIFTNDTLPAGTVDVELSIPSRGSSPTKHKLRRTDLYTHCERWLPHLLEDVVVDKVGEGHEFLGPFLVSVARSDLHWHRSRSCHTSQVL